MHTGIRGRLNLEIEIRDSLGVGELDYSIISLGELSEKFKDKGIIGLRLVIVDNILYISKGTLWDNSDLEGRLNILGGLKGLLVIRLPLGANKSILDRIDLEVLLSRCKDLSLKGNIRHEHEDIGDRVFYLSNEGSELYVTNRLRVGNKSMIVSGRVLSNSNKLLGKINRFELSLGKVLEYKVNKIHKNSFSSLHYEKSVEFLTVSFFVCC